MSPLIYQPLDIIKREIRLLKISYDQRDNTIRGTVCIAALSEKPRFTALSYLWGDPKVTENALMDGQLLPITVNLAAALRHARQHWQRVFPARPVDELLFWADAICINQADVAERNKQVLLMADIYSSAELVLSWLGGNDHSTHLAFDTFELVAAEAAHLSVEQLSSMEWMRSQPSLCDNSWETNNSEVFPNNEKWSAAVKLFELEYWSRIWIFQETALAVHLVFCTESRTLDYSTLELSWITLKDLKDNIQEQRLACPDFLLGSSVWLLLSTTFVDWAIIQKISAGRLMATRLSARDQSPEDRAGGWMISLMGRGLRATNPKDHVYGLMSLSQISVIPDYSKGKSVGAVYRDYVSALLTAFSADIVHAEQHPLFFLFYGGVGIYKNELDLPSWAPNFPEESVKSIAGGLPEMNANSADYSVFPPDTPIASISGSKLQARGVVVDAIVRVKKAPSEET